MRICVMSYRKAGGTEVPAAFYLGGRRLPVVSVLEHWAEGTSRYHEVRIEDGRRFVLRHDPPTRCWYLAAVYAASSPRAVRAPAQPPQPPAQPVKALAT